MGKSIIMWYTNVRNSESQLSPHFHSVHMWQLSSLTYVRTSQCRRVNLGSSCCVFALKLRQKSVKTPLSGSINSIHRRWRNAIMDVLNVYDGQARWSMCVWLSGHSWTFDPLGGLYIKPKRKHWSKGQAMTAPAGLFHLSLCDGWAADNQSDSLQRTLVHFHLWTQVQLPPRKAQVPAIDPCHN